MTRTTWNHIKHPDAPLRWRKPQHVRVALTGAETDAETDRIFAVMALAPAHTFEVLAAAERISEYLTKPYMPGRICDVAAKKGNYLHKAETIRHDGGEYRKLTPVAWPLPNVAIGTICRTQAEVDRAVPLLLSMPNVHPWLRIEPSERIIVAKAMHSARTAGLKATGLSQRQVEDLAGTFHGLDGLRYVELSGKTGPDAAPMHPSWARQIRDDCAAANVPFRFDSWGQWVPYDDDHWPASIARDDVRDRDHTKFVGDVEMYPAGPRRSGRTLDGVEHDGRIEFNQQKGDR